MKNILITGIRGFIGFNAIRRWVKLHPEYTYVGVDGNTYADQFLHDKKAEWLRTHQIPLYYAKLGEVAAALNIDEIVTTHKIDTIVHFAAESHVDNSIASPDIFFKSNVLGTVDILNVAKMHNLRVHLVSTDEVIGTKTPEDYSAEDANYNPSSPYSSSKASAELIALSYHKTYGTRVTISRCTNNIGEWQMTEKLIPLTILNALNNKKIPIYGNGLQRRFWVDVNFHNDALMHIIENGKIGEIYHIKPNKENLLTNIDLVKMILKATNSSESLIEHVTDRLGHDTCYYLTDTKLADLNVVDNTKFEDTLNRTIQWYIENIGDLNEYLH